MNGKKVAGWVLGIIAVVGLGLGFRLYRLYKQLVIVTAVEGVKLSKGNIVIRVSSLLKNPTASQLTIRPPFVNILVNGASVGTSLIPANPEPIVIRSTAETRVPTELQIPFSSIPAFVKANQEIEIQTFIRFGPGGVFSTTQKEKVKISIPI